MLTAKNLFKKFGNVSVLNGVNISIKEAEIVSIVGASGAGKSTLLQLLGTLDKPDAGEVLFKNIKYNDFSENELATFRNKELGFVFQFHNLMAELTALENIMLPAWIGNDKSIEVLDRAKELLSLMNLSQRDNHFPSQLSGGEQQRIAVARALINKPSIVFADEPSGNLDTKNADELHELFFNIRKHLGCSFVIVTHNDKFADLADKKLIIKDGKIL